MKIALIGVNAKYIHTNLALLNLKSYAGNYQEQIVTAEYTINQMEDQIVEEIYKLKADILCFSRSCSRDGFCEKSILSMTKWITASTSLWSILRIHA